jgi:hypothetical protein
MSDQVVGTAILDKSLSPQKLIVLCHTTSGLKLTEVIPVYPRGSQKPVTHNGAAWEYVEDGETLHITPSLHCMSKRPAKGADHGDESSWVWQTDFHNSYAWSVKFQLADSRPRDAGWESSHLYSQIRDANETE